MQFEPEIQSSTQKTVGEELIKLAGKYKNFTVFNANTATEFGLSNFGKEFGDRYIDFGNAMSGMIGSAAGFAVRGKVPFLFGSANDLIGKNWLAIRNALCVSQTNVKLIGAYGGMLSGQDGPFNHALEDLSLMRVVPNMKVVCPADSIEAKKALEVMMLDFGPTYLRLFSLPLPNLYSPDHKFVFGKGHIYKSGNDICIFAIGTGVHTALDAAEHLEREGKSVMVVNISSLKPIDDDLIVECAKAVNHVFTVEDHQIVGGLGSAVCEILTAEYPMKVHRIGMDGFSESARVDDLYKKFQLDGVGIAEQIMKQI